MMTESKKWTIRELTECKRWTIRELTPDEYPDTQLQYEVRDETGEVVSLHFWEEDAKQMAAVPLLREALSMVANVTNYLEKEGN
ncbi:MAG: hypothetical protein EBQ89_02975, partial [Alphaproteobacteria bacterium]|nr:hypothetical protein [Alphaproteobacteria bacterium]NDG20024.1 hypothetical protein [Betaproteobacteria bacterium]